MLPEGSDGSIASPVTLPEGSAIAASRMPAADRRRADRRPVLARQRVGLAQREDPEAGADVVAARLAQAGGRQRLLEGQRPAVEACPVPLPVLAIVAF